ncbi:hypothetical protein VAWG005_29750 [Aeromonas dhakensis]|nr:hypothetical protein VAWG003_29730 [Aeromonas dhakensis]BEE27047.1 hypothetical protein VAWG005_29750 [Aeromonas dhakensis]
MTRHSAITHQRSNGAGNKAARSEAGAANAPVASRSGGKAGNGKPAHKGKAPTRAGSAKPGAKSAT